MLLNLFGKLTGDNMDKTSIYTYSPSPAIKWLNKHVFSITNPETIMDFRAGRYCRNAEYLRSCGFKVYAYDPNHGSMEADPYNGETPFKLPYCRNPDVVFTCFVLNTIESKEDFDDILTTCEYKSVMRTYHITRNKDLLKLGTEEEVREGVRTSKGFQRLIDLEPHGFEILHETRDYIIWAELI